MIVEGGTYYVVVGGTINPTEVGWGGVIFTLSLHSAVNLSHTSISDMLQLRKLYHSPHFLSYVRGSLLPDVRGTWEFCIGVHPQYGMVLGLEVIFTTEVC